MTVPNDANTPLRRGRLRLRTLGDASLDLLDDDGVTIDHQEMSKALALVTYLACAPTKCAAREHLIDLLWSDLDVAEGKHALRQHLWLIRRRFGDVLVADRKGPVRLAPGTQFDRDDLLAAADLGSCERVVERYRGDFFLGFAAPGSSEFERWADIERARLRSVFVRCAEELVRQYLSSGRMRDGQSLAKKVRDADPLAQHGWRLLIEAHISGGDDLGARVEADALEQLLKSEEMEAEPASRALITSVLRGPSRRAEVTTGRFSDLVGREAEFAWLMQAWHSATEGGAVCAHIIAPAGFGKTRLLQDFRARLASLKARVVVVRADAGSTAIPLALLSDLVTALGGIPGAGGVTPEVAATLVGLAPSLASTYPAAHPEQGSTDQPHVRRSALRDLLAAIAEERPLAVLIDDLHWSDLDSAALLAGALGSLGKQRVLVVVAQRPAGATPTFVAEAHQFTLAPLSESAIAALLVSIASLPSASWSDGLARELRRATGGSPLLVVETLQLAKQRAVLAVTAGAWLCTDAAALAILLEAGGAVHQRLARLDARERELVAILALAQTPVPFDILRHASREPAETLRAALGTLEHRGLVREAEGHWQIGHDEYAAAVTSGLSKLEKRPFHAALGQAFLANSSSGARLHRLAPRHLRLGEDWDTLRTAFATRIRESTRWGDRRTLLGLASDFLGADASDSEAERLVALLPLQTRLGLTTPKRQAAAVLLALAAPAMALWFALAPAQSAIAQPDEVALIGFSDDSGGIVFQELPLFERALKQDSAIVLSRVDRKSVV